MTGEAFKGGLHAFTGGLAMAMALYNLMRFAEERRAKNGLNAAVYAGLWAFETINTREHWS